MARSVGAVAGDLLSRLRLSELDSGSWVIFELPGFATAASGTPEDSLDALRKASATSYDKDKDALWVKVVSTGEGAASPARALVEPAFRSAGKRNPAVWSESPGRRRGSEGLGLPFLA